MHNPGMEVAMNPNYEFTSKVRQLFGQCLFATVELFGKFCWRFASLASLRMLWQPKISFTQLVAKLTLLAQLTHLELIINFERHPENAFALEECCKKEKHRQDSLPQVKSLQLVIITKRSQYHFEQLSPLVFLSVEVVILCDYSNTRYQCTTCRYARYDLEMVNQCHQLLILSLKSKFTNSKARFYARNTRTGLAFVDWTNYTKTDYDALPVIGHDNEDR